MASNANALEQFGKVKGLLDAVRSGKLESESEAQLIVGCELLLEGLHAQKKVARSFEAGAASYKQERQDKQSRRNRELDEWGLN